MTQQSPNFLQDLTTLAKPGITFMSVLMAAGGMALARPGYSLLGWLLPLGFIALCVAAANALNMYLEREGDKLMARTRRRPLPAGRMSARGVLFGGLLAGLTSVVGLALVSNPLTALLGALSLISYVWIYTPLKRRTPWALVIGAFPGAAPPLMGWTAVTGRIDAVGIVLFLILLLWQIPHFIAIAIYRQQDYDRAGIKAWPSVRGMDDAKVQALVYSLVLVPVSLLLVPLGAAGFVYFAVAGGAGAWFFISCLRGFEPQSGARWARAFFLVTLAYLPLLTAALAVDVFWMSS